METFPWELFYKMYKDNLFVFRDLQERTDRSQGENPNHSDSAEGWTNFWRGRLTSVITWRRKKINQ